MVVLDLNLGHISAIESSIKRTTNAMEKRQSDYEGAVKDLNGIPSSSGNLSQSNVYLRKKNEQLQNKMNKLNSFKSKLSTFSSNAQAADKRVANYIEDKTETFYKTVGIKTGWAAGWDSFKKGAKKTWKKIKEFYEDHKFVIDFIVDLVMLGAAVISLLAAIPTGGLTVAASIWAIGTTLGDLFGDGMALFYHAIGDDEKAGIWAERGMKDAIVWIGGKTTELFFGDKEIGEKLAGFLYDGASLFFVVYSICKMGKNLFKSVDLRNTNDISVWGRFKTAGKEILGFSSTDLSNGTLKGCISIKTIVGLKSVDSARGLKIVCDFAKNIKQTYKICDSIYEGTFFEGGNKIGESIGKFFDGIIDFTNSTKEYSQSIKDYAIKSNYVSVW